MAHVCFSVAIVAILVAAQSHAVSAKRGCSAFGHSCFGGHGKRSGAGDTSAMDVSDYATNPDMVRRGQAGQEETPPHPGYPPHPHPGYNGLLSGDDIIPVRDGGAYDRDDTAREVMKFKLRNIVKHWMDTYRRSQNEDGYITEKK